MLIMKVYFLIKNKRENIPLKLLEKLNRIIFGFGSIVSCHKTWICSLYLNPKDLFLNIIIFYKAQIKVFDLGFRILT